MDAQPLLYALAEHNATKLRSPEEQHAFLTAFLVQHRAIIPETIATPLDLLSELRRLEWMRWEDATTLRVSAPVPHNEIDLVKTRLESAGVTAKTPLDNSLPLLVGLYSEGGLSRAFSALTVASYSLGRTGEGLQQYAAQKNWIRRSLYRRADGLWLYWIRPPAENLPTDVDKAA